jgi:hypothetical protein
MSTLAEIEAAVEQLPPTQQETLFAFLAKQLGRTPGSEGTMPDGKIPLLDLATHAEPMGALTNAEIDQAVYGR